MSSGQHVPAESVDVTSATFSDLERGRDRARHLSTAALVVAAVAWIAVFFVGVKGSETNGIIASWFAIFPTGFGIAGRTAVENGASATKSLGVAFVAGVLSSAGLWLFFEGIWPSL